MNKLKGNDLDALKEMKNLEVEFPEILTDIEEYQAETDAIAIDISDSDLAIKVKANVDDANSDTVTRLKKKMADFLEGAVVRAGLKAASLDIPTLALSLDKPFSFFYYGTKDLLVERAEAYEKLLVDHKTELSNLKAIDFTNIHSSLLAYKASKEIPKVSKKKKKAAGTDALTIALKRGNKRKNNMLKLLVNYYKVVNPEIANRAKLAAKVIITAKHTGGKYSVIDKNTGIGIKGVTITKVHTSKKGKVKTRKFLLDDDGNQVFEKHSLSEFVLTAVVKDYLTAASTVRFKKNDPNEFVMEMTKVLPKVL